MNHLILLFVLVLPKESLRFQFCHEQGFDTSCGMTVAATALDRYWGIPVTEWELVAETLADKLVSGDYTVSLADMATALKAHGIASRAYEADWDKLIEIAGKGFVPLILHYDRPVAHFALLLGFKDGRAITVDPARGIESLSRTVFEARYSGVAMALAARGRSVDLDAVNEAIAWASGKRSLMEDAALRGATW